MCRLFISLSKPLPRDDHRISESRSFSPYLWLRQLWFTGSPQPLTFTRPAGGCPHLHPVHPSLLWGLRWRDFSLRARPPSNCLLFKGGGGGSKHFIHQSTSNLKRCPLSSPPCSKSGIRESPWRKSSCSREKYEHGWCNRMCTMCADCQGWS